MNIRTWIILIVFLVWGVLCWNWYTCVIKGYCFLEKFKFYEPTLENNESAFVFNNSSFVAIKSKGYSSFVNSIKQNIGNGNTILLAGLYDIREANKSTFQNLGLARAFNIKSYLANDLDTSKIIISSRQADLNMEKSFIAHETSFFISEYFGKEGDNTNINQTQIGQNKSAATDKNKILTSDKGVEFYFDKNSVVRNKTTELENYLNNLAEELKTKGNTIYITGYTETLENVSLRRKRAWLIKSELLSKGVNSTQLITLAADDSTLPAKTDIENGAINNKRVVITYK